MPNIGALLKEEISRLSRKEVRGHVESIRKASAQYRRHIAALKRQVAKLERQVATLAKRTVSAPAPASATANGTKLRFVAKGLRSQRQRLGLSATEYGKLVGVSAQSVYNWERGVATPRQAQLAGIAAMRSLSKREARARLEIAPAPRAGKARAA